ncbi:ComF family protein [Cohnella xylanilytica]|uniref:ComF family protein n=1 Tax=Cohnella xylanilytica TaxID=557555 RepID=A0A841U252_9BACL|nr:ComF family protein [Cohnella xylanilytica]MBB6692180.1 ComF family protein [Cohnella xylanilytica]
MKWLDRLHGLLAVSAGEACPVCGKDGRPSLAAAALPVRHAAPARELRRLCGDCLARIPWIANAICPVCGRPDRCGDCLRRRERHFERCRGAVRYDETMKEWLALYKYRGLEKLEPVMAAILAGAVERLLSSAAAPAPFDLITSVPLAEQRLEERGFNQAERMAMRISEWYRIPYVPLLRRVRHSDKQSFKGRKDRLENMRGNFAPMAEAIDGLLGYGVSRGNGKLRHSVPSVTPSPTSALFSPPTVLRILIADDIYTTGSTMNECALALRMGLPSCEVYGALWARS